MSRSVDAALVDLGIGVISQIRASDCRRYRSARPEGKWKSEEADLPAQNPCLKKKVDGE
jgi:hypothetical protein